MKLLAAIMAKDEAAIIERCLESLKGRVDYILLANTGSTDKTVELFTAFCKKHVIAWNVVDTPWLNFGHNRTELLRHASFQRNMDYVLMIDADETLDGDPLEAGLKSDYYDVRMDTGGMYYNLPRLTNNRKAFSYRGVTHEYLVNPGGTTFGGLASGLTIRQINDSTRRKSGQKFLNDIELLTKALENKEDPEMEPRYTFYLAQSYMDAGLLDEAARWYYKRCSLGGWDQEIYYSLYQLGNISARRDSFDCVHWFLEAAKRCPERAEALANLRDFLNTRIAALQPPATGLFIEGHKYGQRT